MAAGTYYYSIKTMQAGANEQSIYTLMSMFLPSKLAKIVQYIDIIRKDCFQVKSNLLTVDNLVFHL